MLGKLGKLGVDLFFPRKCLNCGKEGQYICDECSLFINELGAFGDVGVFEYNGIIQKALKEVKYRYTKDILNELIEKAFQIILDNNNRYRFNDFLSFLVNEKPVVTYVPMYKKKERYRGFNQSEMIARKIGEVFNLEVIGLLKKTRETKSQTKLNKEERFRNVQSSVTNTAAFDTELSNISTVLLVDDIFTTGATMNECKRVLREMGIENIRGFTLARTT